MRLLACVLLIAAGNLEAEPMFAVLNKDMHWLPGNFVPGRQPDGNTVLLRGDEGWIVVDSGRHAEHTQRILDFALDSELPIAAIVNTHWHLDHVSGNPMLRREYPDARVYASTGIEQAMGGFLAGYRRDLQTQIAATQNDNAKAAWQAEVERIDAGEALYPDVAISESSTMTLAGREIAVHLAARAATEGDVWLFDRRTRTLIAGDLVTLPVPFLDTACPLHWQQALSSLEATRFRTLVPGHGKPMSHSRFKDYRSGFDALLTCAASDASVAACSDQWLENVDGLIADADHAFTRDLLEYYIGQILRGDARRIAQYCGD
jgi:glyoxylase-like metal-dependent hydrolase (beta-lactamase superfamily II)